MPSSRFARLAVLAFAVLAANACKQPPSSRPGEKTLRYPVRADIGSLDPVRASTQYQNLPEGAIFDTLIQFRYPFRPYELEPSLLTKMPDISADNLTYTFELKRGVRFQDDPAFAGGKGREIVTDDFFYSLKRSCDPHWSPTGYWLLQGRIVGLDEYKDAQGAAQEAAVSAERPFRFDYDADVAGLRKLDDHHFQVVLTEPFPQVLYVLTMGFFSIVPREAVEAYDLEFGGHPVGSGPFRLKDYWPGSSLELVRNETYREEYFPAELPPEALADGWGRYAGRKLPLIDRIVFEVYQQDQPMWLKFSAGDLDVIQVPAEYWPIVFDKTGTLKESARADGLRNYNLPLLDLIYYGFNMEDETWGKPPEMKLVRQAISYALDLEARNAAFYNAQNTIYLGPIPPGLDGYEPGFRKRDVAKARELMAQAGYPMGKGLPQLLNESSKGGNQVEQEEMLSRSLRDIGIEVVTNFNSFPELDDKLKKRKATFFGLAWGADYPDAENFLQLFYGPNASPGSNNFNYSNPEYDALFARARIMPPSDERTALYRTLRDMVIEDQPMIGSMARTRYYLWHPRLRNHVPEEVYFSWWKYLDVEDTPAAAGR